MKKIMFFSLLTIFLITFVSISTNTVSDSEICCCENECGIDAGCTWMGECTGTYTRCNNHFCPYGVCEESQDCNAWDTDDDGTNDGIDTLTRGTCYYRNCNLNGVCYITADSKDDCSTDGKSVIEAHPRTDQTNKCERTTISCPGEYPKCIEDENGIGACVVCEPNECDYSNRKYCIDEKTWSEQDDDVYCENCESCGDNSCNCGETIDSCYEDCKCNPSDHNFCSDSKKDVISCDQGLKDECILSGDWKYYYLDMDKNQEVNVTLINQGNGCEKNALYIKDSNCMGIDSDISDDDVKEWIGIPNENIAIAVYGKSKNENCRFDLEIDCKKACGDRNEECNGPFESVLAGTDTKFTGCLYSMPFSQVFSIKESANREMHVKLTNDDDCGKNELFILDGCTEIDSVEGNNIEKEWVGEHRNNIKVEIRSNTNKKYCGWELEVDYAKSVDCGNDICNSGENCNNCPSDCPCDDSETCCPNGNGYECVDIKTDEDNCGSCGTKCLNNKVCASGECVEGEGSITRTLYKGRNIIGIPGLTSGDFDNCDLAHWQNSDRDCLYDENGYFVYRDMKTDVPDGDCGKRWKTDGRMKSGLGYQIYTHNDCEIVFDRPTDEMEIILYPGKNLVSFPMDVYENEIAELCGDDTDDGIEVFTHFINSDGDCKYDNNGHFVFYNSWSSSSSIGDCGKRYMTAGGKENNRPLESFIGHYVWFNGISGTWEEPTEKECKIIYSYDENGPQLTKG